MPVDGAGPRSGDGEVSIRAAVDGDGDGLIRLVGSCFSEYDGCVLDTENEMPHLLCVATHFGAVEGRAWVVEADGAVVGSVACRPVAGGGLELQMLYVLAPWRRQGLGARLVALVEQEAAGRGADFVDLWTDTRFLDAHRLYRSLVYQQLPEVRDVHDLSASREFHFRKSLRP